MELKRGNFLIFLISILFLINPITENLYENNAVAFMASHYALFASGFWFGTKRMRIQSIPWIILGSIIVVASHVPFVFDLTSRFEFWRIVVEILLALSGFLMGSSLRLGSKLSYSLFGGWMAGDTSLSAAFMLGDKAYVYPLSTYPDWQIKDAGIFMFLFMNIVAFFIIMKVLIKVFESE
ncbi:DUF1404 domain-containing protein [Metallosphaera tengchongensis]|uniref:DUF1404 domain-containing protein n=1 Tax=Metallosphaera tengchongensis TaxID=1532350 RepID=A0A6N0NYQ0_9CREN|nr:DUF1404 family protein [Metallosphaera tengchongensis]QKR00271.1 DUF1404 domain-containing protein [Metallosphaera tengchongensis]